MNKQDELITRIGCLLIGRTLDKEHSEQLLAIVLPVIILSGVKIK